MEMESKRNLLLALHPSPCYDVFMSKNASTEFAAFVDNNEFRLKRLQMMELLYLFDNMRSNETQVHQSNMDNLALSLAIVFDHRDTRSYPPRDSRLHGSLPHNVEVIGAREGRQVESDAEHGERNFTCSPFLPVI